MGNINPTLKYEKTSGNLEIKTFSAESKEILKKLIDNFYKEYPTAKIQSTTHKVSYYEDCEKHNYAIFYLN